MQNDYSRANNSFSIVFLNIIAQWWTIYVVLKRTQPAAVFIPFRWAIGDCTWSFWNLWWTSLFPWSYKYCIFTQYIAFKRTFSSPIRRAEYIAINRAFVASIRWANSVALWWTQCDAFQCTKLSSIRRTVVSSKYSDSSGSRYNTFKMSISSYLSPPINSPVTIHPRSPVLFLAMHPPNFPVINHLLSQAGFLLILLPTIPALNLASVLQITQLKALSRLRRLLFLLHLWIQTHRRLLASILLIRHQIFQQPLVLASITQILNLFSTMTTNRIVRGSQDSRKRPRGG